MSSHRKRIDALKALIAASTIQAADKSTISAEFEEVQSCARVRNTPRRWLLQVLHSTRALDTALAVYILTHGGRDPRILGQALIYVRDNTGPNGNNLPESWRSTYQTNIVNGRNRYMHQAGHFPGNSTEIATLLKWMERCLTHVLTRW